MIRCGITKCSDGRLDLCHFQRIRKSTNYDERPVSVAVKDKAFGAGDIEFNFQVVQIGHNVAICLPPLRRFFGVVLPRR